jgi:probable rRNA maturation factor
MILSFEVEHDGWNDLAGLEPLAARAVRETLKEGDKGGEILVLLTSDKEVRALNKLWRGLDKPTNVLSFPFPADAPVPPGEARPLGDIALAFETVCTEAIDQKKPPRDHALHLIVHGLLHLLGHDHEEEGEAEAMEALEREILSKLDIKDPYAT